MADKLTIRLDAAQIFPQAAQGADADITIADTGAQALKEGVWIEPVNGVLMIEPLQFLTDSYLNTEIVRQGKAAWTLSDSHWDEVKREEERWLLSDGIAETIETKTIFPKNAGFMFKFLLFGTGDDLYDALELYFGQWKLRVRSDGLTGLYKIGEEFARVMGSIAGAAQDKLVSSISELTIMPSFDGRLYIRRNSVAGFRYKLPAEEAGSALGVIEAGAFRVKTYSSKRVRLELTQLRWPIASGDYYYVTPPMLFLRAPAEGLEPGVEIVADIPGSGGYVADVYEGYEPGATWEDIVAHPFIGDGVKTSYCVGIALVGDTERTSSPMVQRMKVSLDLGEREEPPEPGDITEDVVSCQVSTGDSALDTVATLRIRNPENHPIFGACNRLCTIQAGDQAVLTGVLKEPPRYVHSEGGDRYYECTVQSLAKCLNEPCLNLMNFDAVGHVEAVKSLCLAPGFLVESDLDFDEDTEKLPDTRSQTQASGETKSRLETEALDRPVDWIEAICDMTGWRFTDGYSSGQFVYKYLDPFALPTLATHHFYMHSADETGDYQRLYSWNPSSVEPEGNELYVIGKDSAGRIIAGRYWDRKSQDPTLPEEERPANWLGFRRLIIGTVEDYPVTEEWLRRLALRAGLEVCQRRDLAEFDADYPVGLWKGDVVEIHDGSEDPDPAVGKYRISRINDIQFSCEWADVPVRRARYEAIRID